MNKVWSVTINGKNDCVIMSEFEAMNVKLKFSDEDFEMYDMTERHGLKPMHLHKLQRQADTMPPGVTWLGDKLPSRTWIKGVGPGQFGGAADMLWEYEDLMAM
jgi:hypothetical protein|tara:strand:+ start:60 stop:368 length:309 start_codon:yes stop_codon:yes gene_type:complete